MIKYLLKDKVLLYINGEQKNRPNSYQRPNHYSFL